MEIHAPAECVVEALQLEPGDLITANQPVIALLDNKQLWVRAYVPEAMLGWVRAGQELEIVVDSFPKRRFKGRVGFIARQGEFTPDNVQTPEERSKQVFRIKVDLEEGLDVLSGPGMAADVFLKAPPL